MQVDRPIRAYRQQGCTIPDCKGRHATLGLCNRHYHHLRVYGDPTKQVNASPRTASYLKGGYRYIYANGRSDVQEHRVVMEQHLGRPLLSNEEVHHRNGQRAQNDIANLELWAKSQPKGQRAVDLLAWAEEIVARYSPERDLL